MREKYVSVDARAGFSRRQFLSRSTLFAASGAVSPLVANTFIPQNGGSAQENASKSSPPPPPVTRTIADWVVRCDKSAVPPGVRHEALRSIVNWIGVTVGGSTQDAVNIALTTLAPFSRPAGGSIFGRAEKLDPPRTALINGISSHVLDFDDTDLRTIIHPAGSVAAALFATCQMQQVSGSDLLHAFILGVEVECRLGRAIYPSHYEMGWHITGTCGAFGAAAACGRLLSLDSRQMQMALGIAATEAAGLKIMFGSMSKSLNVGRAAENGLLAASLAAKGFSSSDESIEGKDGYIYATSRQHNYEALTEGLGEHYEISNNTYKPFACGIVIHPTIDAVIQLRGRYNLKAENVRSIVVRANPLVLQLTGKQEPKDGLEGKFSIYHSVAAALVCGYAGPSEYTDEMVNDPAILALRRRVTVHIDSSVRTDEAFVMVTTVDSRVLEEHVEHAVGSIKRPLTDSELDAKFRQLANNILPARQVEELLALAWNLEACTNAAELPRKGALSLSQLKKPQVISE